MEAATVREAEGAAVAEPARERDNIFNHKKTEKKETILSKFNKRDFLNSTSM
jgi:hypothetical protein